MFTTRSVKILETVMMALGPYIARVQLVDSHDGARAMS